MQLTEYRDDLTPGGGRRHSWYISKNDSLGPCQGDPEKWSADDILGEDHCKTTLWPS